MNCLLWNCRGANKPNFRCSIRYILKKFNTDILALFETHAGGDREQRSCQGLGFENSFRVDVVGQSGGLWLLWKAEVGEVTIVNSSSQFIHARIVNGVEALHLVTVYAAPSASRRSGLWEKLRDVVQAIDEPLIIGGDFNTIIRTDERIGGNGQLSPDSVAFGNWVSDLFLIDMGFKGNRYTWKRGRAASNFIAKRLDRVFCCAHSRLKWQEAFVKHLAVLSSDHTPLYIQLCLEVKRDRASDLLYSKEKLKKWNKEVFGNIQQRKDKLVQEIQAVQDFLEHNQTDDLLNKEDVLIKEFEVVLEQEEIVWFQKSREKWIALGDRNTKYFHTSTIIRRRRNQIEMLKDDEGKWVEEPEELAKMAVEYYQKLYSVEDVDSIVERLPSAGFTCLTREEISDLSKPFMSIDVENSMRGMGRFKAPGPDGYQPVFYQDCWEVVGQSVTNFVLNFFETGQLPNEANDAMLV
uniref:Non-LTR reverse transcriptase n=1 Tax=Arabidopsis cebennensis TaxID=97979 RepID=B2BXY9_9BRAS|nr:non-LTR reverse transcriptase [Arabidopsis cebennensis]